ncbi:Mitochondrial fission protein ELM1 [Striga hermonthica]|uniref:Mitochondrial fission protein ELM1 n=1 Tax=Striga hermonthica TaxID=68872 RepID=A0A9N7RSM7_STRHE|nr:Mitochondrial fission protein ELM1 [Striga hermonthica]
MRAIRRAVIIGNGFAGAENQCIGLVRALGLSNNYSRYRVSRPRGGMNERLHWLPVSVHKRLDHALKWINGKQVVPFPAQGEDVLEADARSIAKLAQETLKRDDPLLVVASGRDTIAVASSVKRLAPQNVFLVQIQHPRSRLNRFDLVITPEHDYYPLMPEAQEQIPFFLRRWVTPRNPPDKHVVLTVGALHRADSAALRNAAFAWHDEMARLPKPLLVVSIGGPTRHCGYGADLAMQLTDSLKSVLQTCGSLRISFSRRTPKTIMDILTDKLSDHPKVYIWNGEDPNPHMGHLAWADAFVITADSVSMLSEACSTGYVQYIYNIYQNFRLCVCACVYVFFFFFITLHYTFGSPRKPVYVIGAERCTWKFSHFLKTLQSRGAIRPFTGKEKISDKWHYIPLSDTENAAGEVIKALAERGWKLMPH